MEKKTSTFLIVLLCIFVAVAGGGVSYLYLADAHNQETDALESQIDQLETDIAKLKKNTKTTSTTTTTTGTTTTATDETANWKTFDSSALGVWEKLEDNSFEPSTSSNLSFTIKYPNSWVINSKIINDSNDKKIGEFAPGAVTIAASDSCFDTKTQNGKKYLIDGRGDQEIIRTSNYSINGNQIELIVTQTTFEPDPELPSSNNTWYPRMFCVKNSTKAAYVNFYDTVTASEKDKTFKQTVDTLIFK